MIRESGFVRKLSVAVRSPVALSQELEWRFSPYSRRSRKELNALRGAHSGQRCFIIGNGPSLNKMDLTLLADEVTFGLNRFYLMFDRLGFSTTYFVAINKLVLEQFGTDIGNLTMPKLVRWEARKLITPRQGVIYVRSKSGPSFSDDLLHGAWGGTTVTFLALQAAFFMGFKEVFLIGVDHNFQTQGNPHEEITSKGPDPDHFTPEYFGEGTRWHLPDLKTSEVAYQLAKDRFEAAGRRVVDATLGGKLRVFPKVDYLSVLAGKA